MQICVTSQHSPITNGTNRVIGEFLRYNPGNKGDLDVRFNEGTSNLEVTSHPSSHGFIAELGGYALYSTRKNTHALMNTSDLLTSYYGLSLVERDSASKILKEFIANRRSVYGALRVDPSPQAIDHLVDRRVHDIFAQSETDKNAAATELLIEQRVQALLTEFIAKNKAAADKEAEVHRLAEEKRLKEEAEAAQQKRVADEILKMQELQAQYKDKMEALLKEELRRLEGLAKMREPAQLATIPCRQITDSIKGVDTSMVLFVCVAVVLVAVVLMKPAPIPQPVQQDLTPLLNLFNQRPQYIEDRRDNQNNRAKDVPSGNMVIQPSWFEDICTFVKNAFYCFIMGLVVLYALARFFACFRNTARICVRERMESDEEDD
jgi:hypothetical protein